MRDIYAIDDAHLLIVATDRLSAFDVVLPDPIPGKGAVLTGLSRFWFSRIEGIVRHHLAPLGVEDVIADARTRAAIADHAMVVRRLAPLPVEAIARGYLIGSGWKDYQRTGAVCGVDLPPGPAAGPTSCPRSSSPLDQGPRPARTTRTSTSRQRRGSSVASLPSGCGT